MRFVHSLLWLIVLSSLLLAALPVTHSYSSQLYVFISSWNGSSWTNPQIAVKVSSANATSDCYQRKVFKTTGNNYFVVFWNLSCKSIQYAASSDMNTWSAAVNLSSFGTFPLGSYNVVYPSHLAGKDGTFFYSGSNGASSFWDYFTVSGLVITKTAGGSLGGQQRASGTSHTSNLNGLWDMGIFHRNNTNQVRLQRSPANSEDTTNSVPFGDPTNTSASGGNQILNYKTSSPYHMIAISKGSDRKLYWSLVNETNRQYISDPFNDLGVTLGVGFNDFCATSEAQNVGDPEKIHLAFGNATGLYYLSFESESWSSITSLGVTGNYPTLAVDSSANLILTYTANNLIYYKTKAPAGSWTASQVLGSSYINAAYLSSSQNEQSGEILLIWTANYNPVIPAPSNTGAWIGITLPYVYGAITLWSIAMIIGVAAVLMKGSVQDLPIVLMIGLGILICLFISLAIMSGFLRF